MGCWRSEGQISQFVRPGALVWRLSGGDGLAREEMVRVKQIGVLRLVLGDEGSKGTRGVRGGQARRNWGMGCVMARLTTLVGGPTLSRQMEMRQFLRVGWEAANQRIQQSCPRKAGECGEFPGSKDGSRP